MEAISIRRIRRRLRILHLAHSPVLDRPGCITLLRGTVSVTSRVARARWSWPAAEHRAAGLPSSGVVEDVKGEVAYDGREAETRI